MSASTLSILVYVASPLDYARYRHTALHFDFSKNIDPESNLNSTHQDPETEHTAQRDFASCKPENNGTINGQLVQNGSTDRPADSSTRSTTSADESPVRSSIMEVVGSPGFFTFVERVNADIPGSERNLTRIIPITSIKNAPPPALRLITSDTPIPLDASEESDWNSQNWVGDALDRLVKAGYLDPDHRDRALDKMVDAVLEAGDEEIG